MFNIKLKNFFRWISELFDKTKKLVRLYIVPAITIVENFKTFVDSPGADILTAIIPGTLDDAAKVFFRAWLPKLLVKMNLIEYYSNDENELLRQALLKIKTLSREDQWNIYNRLARELTAAQADGKLSFTEIYHLVEGTFNEIYHPERLTIKTAA